MDIHNKLVEDNSAELDEYMKSFWFLNTWSHFEIPMMLPYFSGRLFTLAQFCLDRIDDRTAAFTLHLMLVWKTRLDFFSSSLALGIETD